MDSLFVQNALAHGEEGKLWLQQIPTIIKHYEKLWHLQVFQPFELSYNYVAPAQTADGADVVLKIGFPKDNEFQTEIAALEVFDGEGVEKLLQKDTEQSVILIEKVTPGIPLSTLDDDEEATRLLAGVMKKLWQPLPHHHPFPTLTTWTAALPTYLAS